MISLVKNIIDFIDLLRKSGARVGISETLDAIEALHYINLTDRFEVRSTLSACLAKSHEDRKIFYEAFDRFFILSQLKSDYIKSKTDELTNKRQELLEEISSLKFQDEQIELDDELKEIYAGLHKEEKESIQRFLQKTSTGKNVKGHFKKIAETAIEGRLKHKKQNHLNLDLHLQSSMYYEELSDPSLILAADVAKSIRQDEDLLYKNIGLISEEELPRALALIRSMIEKLSRNITRKYKKTHQKASFDIKRTIRSNIGSGGLLFDLKFRKRPQRKNKFLIMCDVSSSMYRVSGFVLQMVAGIYSSVLCSEIYIFSEVSDRLNIPAVLNLHTFEDIVKKSHVWKRGTNINSALDKLLYKNNTLTSSTIVMIISDAKTQDYMLAAEKLKTLSSRVKRVVWMITLPMKDWEDIPSINAFKKYCTFLDCSSLKNISASTNKLNIHSR